MVRTASAIGFLILLGAAAPTTMNVQIADLGPLARTEPLPQQEPAKTLHFQNALYQAAPMPDEDVSPPPGAVQTEAQLAPKILSPRTIIQGDGYANGSSQQGSIANRKSGAAGLGLSVPVN